ncbi:ABC transporter [Fusarium albosuccineum]|uniref:ABC transporter n=1 Tax=Fusarium albosuccineum TaxID=1237068 RepID=A0A8H4L9D7_9HYPO|nr:ABC transporter [Fusarium albosuccineum]
MSSEEKTNSNMPYDEKPPPVDQSPKTEEDATKTKDTEGGGSEYFRIFRYADSLDRLLYAISFTGAIAVGAALPLMTLVFGSSTSALNDYASGQGDPQDLQDSVNHLVLYFIYLFIGRFVIGYVATLCICIAATRTTNSLRKAFLESLLRQEVAHFDTQGNGAVATQVTTNGHRINQGIAEKLYTMVMGISLFFSAYIVALAVHWKLALITMSIVPAIVLIVGGCIRLDAPIEARIVRIYSRAATLVQDVLSSTKTIYAFGAQHKIVEWYDKYLQEAHNEGKKKSILYGVLFSCQTFLVMSGTALAFWEGFRMFQSGEIQDVGTVFTVVLSVTLGATSVLFCIPQIGAITNASSAAAELFSIIDKPSLLDPLSSDGKKPAACSGEIEFRHVSFAYPTRSTAPVLQNLSLSLPAGKTTALVGPSGCGKSTLVGLLERWYQPTSGQILLDGYNIAEFNTQWLRSNMRVVQQEPTLFQGTVLENVGQGLVGEQLSLTEESRVKLVEQACIAADAHDFINRLPEGYHTKIGERGSMLSGGQRQRISIARSIISDPKILLFDEATSALDPRAEKVVQEALNRVSANKTTLIIAHKLATVMAADNIAVMANGVVVEQGTHRELIKRDGLYAAMVRAQDLGCEAREQDHLQHVHEGAYGNDADNELIEAIPHEKPLEATRMSAEDRLKHLTAGTAGYSLAKCIITMLKEHRDLYRWYAVLVFAYVILAGTYPAQAILFSRLIKTFTLQGSDAKQQADFYALMFFVLALANLVGYFCIGIATNVIGQVLTYRYRREMLERVLDFDQDFFDCSENSSGALTAKLSSVPSAVQELLSANIGLIVNVIINVIASSALGIAYGWKLGLTLVFGGLSIIVGSGYIRIRLDQKLEAQTGKEFTSSAALAAEAVTSIRTVSLLTLEGPIVRRYSESLDALTSRAIRNLIPTLVPYSFSQSADFLVMALGFWYGSRLIASGEYTVTQFFVIFISVVFGGQAAAQFFTWTTSITKAKASANYILWLRTLKSQICETEDNRGRGPPGDDALVTTENMEFRYPQREDVRVLRGFSINIEPGTCAAFVGPSGCGKSTIISLLERFYDPSSGRITLNDHDISLMSPSLYRRHMSLVQQEPPLYPGSVRDNIEIGLTHKPSDDEMLEACRQANILDFISSLPEGLNTPCGSQGLQFSGGQRQRIAVARALIRNPRLLLLDEATSALDSQSERMVQEALDKAASGRTTVVVAHRMSTIRRSDIIFVIEDGRITEVGTHEELQRLQGRYYAMCLAQSLDQP